jgi:hypothetical protein
MGEMQTKRENSTKYKYQIARGAYEIDPASHTSHDCLPFARVTHDNVTTLLVVRFDTHLHNILFRL